MDTHNPWRLNLHLWQLWSIQFSPTQSLHVADVEVAEVQAGLQRGGAQVKMRDERNHNGGETVTTHHPGGVGLVDELDHLREGGGGEVGPRTGDGERHKCTQESR